MKTKFLLGILLTVILLAVTVSAAENFTITPSEVVLGKFVDGSQVLRVKNTGTEVLSLIFEDTITIDGENSDSVVLSISGEIDGLETGRTKDLIVEIKTEPTDWDNFDLGEKYSEAVTFNDGSETVNVTLSVVNGFCDAGSFGDLEIIEVKDREKDNEDEWDWAPLDDVEFRVEVYNDFDDKERIKIEYEIYDDEGKKVDFDEDDNEQSISIDDGDSEKVTFSLRVPADMDDGDYKLFIKAYVKGKESDIDDPEEAGCIDNFDDSYYQKITIDREEDRAVIVDIEKLTTPDFVMCGDLITLYAKVYNIGVEDEDKVKVQLHSADLGITLNEVLNDLEEGESATVTFNFRIPENVEEKHYLFRFINFYEYDEDDDEYDSNSKDDLDENFNFNLKVNCIPEKQLSALITAELDSDPVAGEQLVIKGTIENTGEERTTYSLSVSQHSSWSELDKIEPSRVTLDVDETEDFFIYLDVDQDAIDEQFFTIEARYNGESTEQEVSVILAGTSAITGSVIGGHLKENWFIWVIIVINIILIIAIIAVARRIVTAR